MVNPNFDVFMLSYDLLMCWYICFPNLYIFVWEFSLLHFKFLQLRYLVNAFHSCCILCDLPSKDPVLSLMVFIFLLFPNINLPCQELSGKICYSSPLQIFSGDLLLEMLHWPVLWQMSLSKLTLAVQLLQRSCLLDFTKMNVVTERLNSVCSKL